VATIRGSSLHGSRRLSITVLSAAVLFVPTQERQSLL
jgi:hypothetical protein